MIEDDAAQVLAFAERARVPEEKLDAIRGGDRRSYLALLQAILETTSAQWPRWAGATFRAEDVEPVRVAARRQFELVAFLDRSGFRQLMSYGRENG